MVVETDKIISDYLQHVEAELTGIPTVRRQELLADLREHIAVERAGLQDESAASVLAIINRLGDPRHIAAEARSDVADTMAAGEPGPTRGGPTAWVRANPGLLLVIVLVVLVALALVGVLFFRLSTSGTAVPLPVHSGSGNLGTS